MVNHPPDLSEWLGGFLGVLEIGIVFMLIFEVIKLFGSLKLSGAGGGSGNAEWKVDQKEAAQQGGLLKFLSREKKETEQVEELQVRELKALNQLKPLLEEIRGLPGNIQPVQIKLLAEKRGRPLLETCKKLLNYSRRSEERINFAEKIANRTLRTLRKELVEHAKTDFTGDSSALESMEHRIDADMKKLVLQAKQYAGAMHKTDDILKQIYAAESAVSRQIEGLVADWSNGDLSRNKISSTIDAVDSAERGVQQVKSYIRTVQGRTKFLIKHLHSERGKLKKAAVKSHYETIKNNP